VGCWKALSKQGLKDLMGDTRPMQRAVAFCQVIEPSNNAKAHRVSSKNIASMFQAVVDAYQEHEETEPASRLRCEARHVDGTMNASQREEKLTWLKANIPDRTCRILSNVRCLSEGVDVPALDAVLFLTPRNSQVDVVQSVGRVMRIAPDKRRGYVILPVVIPAGVEPHEALNDNKTYAVVWQVLQALRSHDDRFDAMVNKMDLDLNRKMLEKMEVISITDKIPVKRKKTTGVTEGQAGRGGNTIGQPQAAAPQNVQHELPFEIGEIERAIYAKVVQKCGNRHHWEDWANDIAKIAHTHIDRITAVVEDTANTKERKAFFDFAAELRDDLNDSISDSEIIEMLAQHLITKPVFDSLFSDYAFASQNPISQAMQGVLGVLQKHRLDKEADTLEAFYESVRERAKGIDNAEGKQKIVAELYDKFFRNAFPKMSERLGIVYTPVEVVDFIIHSVDHLLTTEFGQTLGSKGVHIIDPFTGTGTFITRLLQSGLIKPEELAQKYRKEIHANEIVLLAYYIAAINIEAVYHNIAGGEYVPFEGICLTDTFQLYEKEDLISRILVDNSARRTRQKKLDIRVILGNPPYSAGQDNANDNNQNVSYPHLDQGIASTYAARSKMASVKNLYDSYIRAIRWASDRIGGCGIVGFVTNAGFLDARSSDGLRKSLVDEFSSIYVFHLRGLRGQKTSGERAKREGGQIFGLASAAAIAITFLVKNPASKSRGRIFFHDIGDYLTREEKLQEITRFHSVAGIAAANAWQPITPDTHGDWLKQRDNSFDAFIVMGDKKSDGDRLFANYSLGIGTNRDAWCYNYSRIAVASNMQRMVDYYNGEVEHFAKSARGLDRKARETIVKSHIGTDPTKISWSSSLLPDLVAFKRGVFDEGKLLPSLYRPFAKQWLYYDGMFNHRVGQMPRIFPDALAENLVIGTSAPSDRSSFSVLISDTLPCLHAADMVGAQYFPLYLYDDADDDDDLDLFVRKGKGGTRSRRDGISDEGLAHFRAAYPGEGISKEDIFYYVYGLLHSPDYRTRYADNLGKELPRIPGVKRAVDFWAFSKAGRKLAALHVDYETVEPFPVTVEAKKSLPASAYRVEKMRYGRAKVDGRTACDRTVLIYNEHITLKGIPVEAYQYVVNGRPALDWVVDQQSVWKDEKSGIVNDANDWATETMKNPKYPLELFQRVITVSLETQKIVATLPGLDI
jgi:predicted helicase